MITLITLTQGNPIALKRTIDNVLSHGLCNEIIVGDMCLFEEDSIIINGMGVKQVPLAFNHLYLNGFGATLNQLAEHATNDLCLYLNVGEIIECNLKKELINPNYNCYAFNHATETHHWIRLWNKHKLKWSGRIHEEVIGDRKLCPTLLFQMADTEKDNGDKFKAQVYNDCKEIVYFYQLLRLVDNPNDIGATNEGWVKYAKDSYNHIKERLLAKGERYQAFIEGNHLKYLENCKEFQSQDNNHLIHFQ